MYVLIIMFIAVVLVIGIFCVTVVCRDIVIESRERRQQESERKIAAKPEPQTIAKPEPQTAAKSEPQAAETQSVAQERQIVLPVAEPVAPEQNAVPPVTEPVAPEQNAVPPVTEPIEQKCEQAEKADEKEPPEPAENVAAVAENPNEKADEKEKVAVVAISEKFDEKADDKADDKADEKSDEKAKIVIPVTDGTLGEEFVALSSALKCYYEGILSRADTAGDEKRVGNANFKDYEIGKNRLVTLEVKNGGIVSELSITMFASKAADGVKQKRIVSPEAIKAAIAGLSAKENNANKPQSVKN